MCEADFLKCKSGLIWPLWNHFAMKVKQFVSNNVVVVVEGNY